MYLNVINFHLNIRSTNTVFSEPETLLEEKNRWKRWLQTMKRTVENYRRHILCMVVFYSVTVALVVERALCKCYSEFLLQKL